MQYAKTNQIEISADGKHHVSQGNRLYPHDFDSVLAFHDPGLAPVKDKTGAYHIHTNGEPAYQKRFNVTFGYYNQLAVVHDSSGFYHISPDGAPAYRERYDWCGNFQKNLCVVKKDKNYFHIDIQGNRVYQQNYAYVGDYRESSAVVCNQDGRHSHIDRQGSLLHDQWFVDLDVYHKGFARAKDEHGWFHIDKNGKPLYKNRFLNIEPFYNNVARVTTHQNDILTINQSAEIVNVIHKQQTNPLGDLSSKLVGFWQGQTIAAAVHLGLLDFLPNSLDVIAHKSQLPRSNILRLLRALWEIDIVYLKNDIWHLTSTGNLLTPTDEAFGAAAAQTWQTINLNNWPQLSELLKKDENKRHLSIKESCKNTDQLNVYHRALDGYTKNDFTFVLEKINWENHNSVIACERTGYTCLNILHEKHKHLKLNVLGHKNNVVGDSNTGKVRKFSHDLKKKWPIEADAVCLARTLHYWPDHDALQILKNAKSSLTQGGRIYIFEMLLKNDSPAGGLLDLNMLAETGGCLRTMSTWNTLINSAKLQITKTQEILPHLKLLILSHNDG